MTEQNTHRLIDLNPDEFLFHEGDRSENIYLVQEGSLRVFRFDTIQGFIELAIVNPNQLVGEMAFFDSAPRSASVQAITPVKLIELNVDILRTHLEEQPKWLKILIETMLGHIRRLNKKAVF